MGFYTGLGTCYGFVIDRTIFHTLLCQRFPWLTTSWHLPLMDGRVLIMIPGSWKHVGGLDADFHPNDLKQGYVPLTSVASFMRDTNGTDDDTKLVHVDPPQAPDAPDAPEDQLLDQIHTMAAWCRVVAGPIMCGTSCCTLSCPPFSSYGPALPIMEDRPMVPLVVCDTDYGSASHAQASTPCTDLIPSSPNTMPYALHTQPIPHTLKRVIHVAAYHTWDKWNIKDMD
jgi:hypothetical protein